MLIAFWISTPDLLRVSYSLTLFSNAWSSVVLSTRPATWSAIIWTVSALSQLYSPGFEWPTFSDPRMRPRLVSGTAIMDEIRSVSRRPNSENSLLPASFSIISAPPPSFSFSTRLPSKGTLPSTLARSGLLLSGTTSSTCLPFSSVSPRVSASKLMSFLSSSHMGMSACLMSTLAPVIFAILFRMSVLNALSLRSFSTPFLVDMSLATAAMPIGMPLSSLNCVADSDMHSLVPSIFLNLTS